MNVYKKNLNQDGFLHLQLQQIQNLDKLVTWLTSLLGLYTDQTEIPWQSNVENFAVFYPKIGHLGADVVRNVQNITQKQKRKSCFTFFSYQLQWRYILDVRSLICSQKF